MKASSRHSEAGFTLLETVVAMTLLAVLMLALSGSIGFVGRTWDKGWRNSERSGALAQVESSMRQLIERSFPAVTQLQGKERFVFKGDAHNLRLVSYETAGRTPPGYQVSEVISAVADGTSRLIYRRQTFSDQGPGQSTATPGRRDEATLLTGNTTLNISYFGTLQPSTPPAWHSDWDSEKRLPDLIRMQILEGSMQAWPTFVIRPMVTTDYACIETTFPGICRAESATQ